MAYLAVECGRPHPREKLAGLLWPDSPEALARANLCHVLTLLRQAIGDRTTRQPVLLASRQTIEFSRQGDAFVDAAAFTALMGRRDLSSMEQAVKLYQGRFLESFSLRGSSAFEEWLLLEQEHLHRLAMQALGHVAAEYESEGDLERALPYARRQLELEPWWESAHQQVMRLLARSGQRDAALAQYQACCRLLAEQVGAEPSPQTTRLCEQIRDGCLSLEPLLPRPAPRLVRRPAALPPFLTAQHPPAVARPVFVAREKELAWLDGHLQAALAGQGQAAFVIGGAGRGKTALLHEFAWRAFDAHPDLLLAQGTCDAYAGVGDPYLPFRQVLAMLSGDVEAAWAAGALATAHARRTWEALPHLAPVLAERGSALVNTLLPGPELMARVRAALPPEEDSRARLERLADPARAPAGGLDQSHLLEQYANVLLDVSAQHPLLVAVDDLQWADPSSISLLFHLGRRLPAGRILIVGAYRPDEVAQEREDERHSLLPVLAEFRRRFGDAWLDLAAVDDVEGQRFVNELVDSEPNALGETFRGRLFQRTSGHPLFAVETLRAMQERGDLVRDQQGLWTEGGALDWEALPARAEAAIAERIDRLPQPLRDILGIAAVEGEEFTAQAVALVQGMDELQVLRVLRHELAGRHRLVREQGELHGGGRPLSRYRFAHILFQQHLYRSLGAGEQRLLHGRVGGALEQLYAGHLDEVAGHLARHFAGDAERERRYARLAGERAAAQFANREAVRYLNRALELTPAGEPGDRYSMLLARETVYDRLGQREAQEQDVAELESLAELLEVEKQAEASIRRARYAHNLGDYPAATAAAQAAAQKAKAAGLPGLEGWSHLRWADALLRVEGAAAARAQYAQALELARAGGLGKLEAEALLGLGNTCNDHAQEWDYDEQALRRALDTGDLQAECRTLSVMNFSWLQAGDLARAWTGLHRSLRLARDIGDRLFEGGALERLGMYYYLLGDYAQARGHFDQALRIAGETDAQFVMITVLSARADVARSMGDMGQGWHDAGLAVQLACEIGGVQAPGIAHQALGHLHREEGHAAQAHACFTQALQVLRRLGPPGWTMESLAGLACAELALGQLVPAQAHVAEILAFLDGGQGLCGNLKPFWTYLTCYQVLTAARDPRAADLLTQAYTQLLEWAARCPDEATRRSFLENVPWHREIVYLWQLAHPEHEGDG